jgi:putative transposase
MRKKKFSSNWKKQKQRISKIHIKIANTKNDYLHKESTTISQNHAVVVLEDLQIGNMSKAAKGNVENPGKNVKAKSGLNKSILDQGWAEFRRQLEYKQLWTGGELIAVPPQYTSQTCPSCGTVSQENRKTQSKFECECGYQGNADHVAAMNILAVGLDRSSLWRKGVSLSVKQEPVGNREKLPLLVN